MKVLVVTNMYPTAEMPAFGTFVHDQVQALRRAGVEVDVFFVNGRECTWNYLWGFPRFWRFLWDRRYDLIHAHYVLSGVIARAQWRYKLVLTHHGPEVLGWPHPWQRWVCRLLTPLCDEAIYVSEEIRRALRDLDGWVIPCGVNLDDFTPLPREEARARLGLPQDKRLVLWAGEHWRPEKRFHLVEQAMARAQAELPDAELVLLTKRPHQVVPLYMNACDALVLTSAVEGSPMVVKEAMACNLPVVSVRVGDVPDVIGDTPGCALAAHDPADIAAKLVAVLREPQRSEGRLRMQHLRHDRIASLLIEVYEHALGRGRERRHASGAERAHG
ncbi:MAG: glycosyltransferase [Chloroflexi bacterium]|nr:glycosyltransferase [Chloroflexota bacterium]